MDFKIGVIADDLTGVTDTGSQFATLRLKTIGNIGNELPSDDAEVKILNTQSRCVTEMEAAKSAEEAAKAIYTEHPQFVMKKIDTALRGNIGIEVKTVLETLNLRTAAFIGAIPKIGRTTIDGIQLYHGVPVQSSILGTDQNNPNQVFTSSIQELFHDFPEITLEKVTLQELRSGEFRVIPSLNGEKKVIIFDIETDEDLDQAVRFTLNGSPPFLYVGSLGLAEALGRVVASQMYLEDRESKPAKVLNSNLQRVLFVSGSPNPNTQKQIAYLKSHSKLQFVEAEPFRLVNEAQYLIDLSDKVSKAINNEKMVFIHINSSTEKLLNLSSSLAEHFANLVEEVLASTEIDALVINGGETAYWVCRMVGIESIKIGGKISEVVAYGQPVSRRNKIKLIITKGGSVGEISIFADILNSLDRLSFL